MSWCHLYYGDIICIVVTSSILWGHQMCCENIYSSPWASHCFLGICFHSYVSALTKPLKTCILWQFGLILFYTLGVFFLSFSFCSLNNVLSYVRKLKPSEPPQKYSPGLRLWLCSVWSWVYLQANSESVSWPFSPASGGISWFYGYLMKATTKRHI